MQSFKLGQPPPPLPDGTPESSAYNGASRRVGIATAYQRKGGYNDSQNDSQGTLEDESNFAKFGDKRRSVSPPDATRQGTGSAGSGRGGETGGGNRYRQRESTSIDQKTTQQMQRLQ